ncbi:lysosomal acid phosphatase-like isoform X2 [Sipha flava]|uniref:acid phosphatase n=1 Tax=Sipha flava TaxID=143950 RepID=A0A8B8FAR6_9HEMI|nr:lysosomal acid phosphatase-like isoform X2 [Sipha flava]
MFYFEVMIFRHGDRTPVFSYKTDINANAFPEEKGDLTKKGKQHMYQKGKFFRRLYNGFISDLYLDSEIIIKTTKMKRTFMSAALVLAGMYPPKDYQKWSELETVWQPIPISNDSPENISLYDSKKTCPSLYKEVQKVFPKLKSRENEPQISELLSYLSEKCGKQITTENLPLLYDLFLSQMANGLQLPEWIKPNHIQTIESIVSSKEILRFIYLNKKIQTLYIAPLLKEISLNMELRSNDSNLKSTRKMHLYSGHDNTVMTASGYLHSDIIGSVYFGASLHFHLYFDNTNGYTIKLFYYGRWDDEKGEEVPIPSCGNPCKLQDFTTFINEIFSPEWGKECQDV